MLKYFGNLKAKPFIRISGVKECKECFANHTATTHSWWNSHITIRKCVQKLQRHISTFLTELPPTRTILAVLILVIQLWTNYCERLLGSMLLPFLWIRASWTWMVTHIKRRRDTLANLFILSPWPFSLLQTFSPLHWLQNKINTN